MERSKLRNESEEQLMRRRMRQRKLHERAERDRARMRALYCESPLLTAREAAVFCRVSYSWLIKQLGAYGRIIDGGGTYEAKKGGIDILAARPERFGRSWIFRRGDLERVLGSGAR